ncbi:MerR family transcriptional regulator [Desulfoluna spongiiphila]|uniref:DNA-binding transcriptional regulator, MerR family n=1 Tax=Desulfoluna spongiiphila TaxID=419481 RepID=A0A1G5D9U6_9BACT|nr:MerR family DNA-binding transcriptional regulator [Desulfoluna spongiiphila]SCY11386.1 DNA-binding transcriptional regulator, MerR family [Desulfoluna spongiiphila]VVS95257.1 merr-type hth domain [Desulfoluna spongiiphila]
MKRQGKEIYYTISDLAREFDISTRSIRFYEEKNLISPRRTEGNQRIYSRRDHVRLKLILRGKRFGYSLEEISEIIGLTDFDIDEVEQIRKTLAMGQKKITDVRERINDLKLLEEELVSFQAKMDARLRELTTDE